MDFWNARVIDGTGRPAFEPAAVRIADGRIVSVESLDGSGGPVPEGAIDLEGRTLMPGLIDAHAHLSSDVFRSPGFGPPPELHGELRRRRELRSFIRGKAAA